MIKRYAMIVCIIAMSVMFSSCGKSITSEAAANSYVQGVWTDTRVGLYSWFKYVFNADGTGERYQARPSADNWGKPSKIIWKVATEKANDTGKRWYGLLVILMILLLTTSSPLSLNTWMHSLFRNNFLNQLRLDSNHAHASQIYTTKVDMTTSHLREALFFLPGSITRPISFFKCFCFTDSLK